MKSRRITVLALTAIIAVLVSANLFASNKKVLHEKTFSVNAGELLEVSAQGGDIGVKAWDKAEVYIKVLGTEKASKKIKFTFKRTDGGVSVKAEKKGSGWFNWGSGISYRILIRAPKNFNVKLKTSGGDVKIFKLAGAHSVKTSGGDIILNGVEGKADLKTSGGDISVEEGSANISAKTSGGDIDVKVNSGDISAKTSGGDIHIKTSEGEISASTSGGDIKIIYSGENKGIKAGTSGGDISLSLSPGIKADLELKTSGGEVEVDFPNSVAEIIKSSKYIGKLNGGGPLIKCATTGGDVTLSAK